MTFEEMANVTKATIQHIEINGIIIAKGIHMPDSIISFCDNDNLIIGYPDTGVFILFKDSHTCTANEKYEKYINNNRKTNREIIFQSRNAAAEFVLGKKGNTNYWK